MPLNEPSSIAAPSSPAGSPIPTAWSPRPARRSPACWCRRGRSGLPRSRPRSRRSKAAKSTRAIPKGKLVVVIEASSAGALGSTLNTIALLPDVFSAALVFHASDAA